MVIRKLLIALVGMIVLVTLEPQSSLAQDTPEPLLTLSHNGKVGGATWSPDDSKIVTFLPDSTSTEPNIYVWDAATGGQLAALYLEGTSPTAYWLSDDRVIAWSDSTVKVWDAQTGSELAVWSPGEGAVKSAYWTTDGNVLAYSTETQVHVCDPVSGEEMFAVPYTGYGVSVQWDSDRERVIIGGSDTQIIDLQSGEVLATLDGEFYGLNKAGTNALTGDGNAVIAWNVDTGEVLFVLPHGNPAWFSFWNEDETRILTRANALSSTNCAVNCHEIRMWDASTGEPVWGFYSPTGVLTDWWSADGSRLLIYNWIVYEPEVLGLVASVLDANTGETLLELEHESVVEDAMWNSDSTQILTLTKNNSIHIWDANTGQSLVTFSEESLITMIQWINDDRILTWSSGSNELRIYDAHSGKPFVVMPQIFSYPRFNHDKDRFTTWIGDVVQVWEIPTASASQVSDAEPGKGTPTPTLKPSVDIQVTAVVDQAATTTLEAIPQISTPTATYLPGEFKNTDWVTITQAFDEVEMVLVPAGCFMMGSENGGNDEKPVHKVCLDAFWIDKTEVTNGQFAVLNGQSSHSAFFHGENLPREHITWTDAQKYCESRGARLPTEAEWEYAARGPESWEYPWGNEFVSDNAVWYENSVNRTGGTPADVGSRPQGASWVGALDMSGNVMEWVADWYDAEYYATVLDGTVNPTGPESGQVHVVRGGSWGDFNSGSYSLRTTDRPLESRVDEYDYRTGFRCARSQ